MEDQVVAVRGAMPRVGLVCPEVLSSGVSLVQSISTTPTSPGLFKRIVHAGEYKVQEHHRIPFFLAQASVDWIQFAERAVIRSALKMRRAQSSGPLGYLREWDALVASIDRLLAARRAKR